MTSVNILRVENTPGIEKILFERPISRLHAKKIGFIVGKRSNIKAISNFYEIVTALGHEIIIIAEDKNSLSNIPANLFLEPQKRLSGGFSNTDEAILLLDQCEYLVINQGIDISARMQIFVEKLFKSSHSKYMYISDTKSIPDFIVDGLSGSVGNILVCDYNSLSGLAKKLNINNRASEENTLSYKIGLVLDIAKITDLSIACTGSTQVIAVTATSMSDIAVINTDKFRSELKNVFASVLVGIMSDDINSSREYLQRVITSGYILSKIETSESDNLARAIKKVI